MRPLVLVCAVGLISPALFAQRGGHGGGGGSHASGGSVHSSGGGVSHASGATRGGYSRGGYGYGRGGVYGYRNYGFRYGYARGVYGWPYYGLGWGSYGWDPYLYGDYYDSAPSYDSSSSYGYAPPNDTGYDQPPPVIVNQAFPYSPPAPPRPEVREYSGPPGPPPPAPSQANENSPVLYLIALKNNNILAALTYWSEKGELHYINLDHQPKQVPLSSIDRALTDRLNRERNITVKLPG